MQVLVKVAPSYFTNLVIFSLFISDNVLILKQGCVSSTGGGNIRPQTTSGPRRPIFKLRMSPFDRNMACQTEIKAQYDPRTKIVAPSCSCTSQMHYLIWWFDFRLEPNYPTALKSATHFQSGYEKTKNYHLAYFINVKNQFCQDIFAKRFY